jgi:hypothetical protein
MNVMSEELKKLVKKNKAKSSGTLLGYIDADLFLNSKTVHYLRVETHEVIIGNEQHDDNFKQSWVVFSVPNDLDENAPEHTVLFHTDDARWGFQIEHENYIADDGVVTFKYSSGKKRISGKFKLSSGKTKVSGNFDISNE